MNEFYTHYYIKSSNKQIETIDEFQNLRIGVILRKDTGDEFIKTDDNVFDKLTRQLQSTQEADGKYAQVGKTNEFSANQILNSVPSDDNHIVNKKYVDDEIVRNKVDTEKYARIDASNVFEFAQVCTAEPLSRAHLTNRAYVDDAINALVFDTSQLAKLNFPNTFTSPQTCTGTITNDLHLVTKQYVDSKVDEINVDTSNFAKLNTENAFSQTQYFNQNIVISQQPFDETDGANKKYVDDAVKNVSTSKADTQNYGTVKFSTDIEGAPDDSLLVPSDALVKQYVNSKNNSLSNEYMNLTTEQNVLGKKNFKNLTVFENTNSNAIKYKMNTFVLDDNFTADFVDSPTGLIVFNDKNDNQIATMGFEYNTVEGEQGLEDSESKTLLDYGLISFVGGKDYDFETGTGVYSYIKTGITNENKPFAKTVTPQDDSNDDSIATTEWVENKRIILRKWE